MLCSLLINRAMGIETCVRVCTRHVDRYILFAFTLGCDCFRTSGVHVTLNHAIDRGKRLYGTVEWLVQARVESE